MNFPLFLTVPLLASSVLAFAGRATWYDAGLGACGWTNSSGQPIVALAEKVWETKPDGGNPNNNPWCGTWVNINYGGVTQQAQIVDLCPRSGGCLDSDGDALDLSTSLFQGFADLGVGIFQMTWSVSKGGSDDSDGGGVGVSVNTDDQEAEKAKQRKQQQQQEEQQQQQEQQRQQEAEQAAAASSSSRAAVRASRCGLPNFCPSCGLERWTSHRSSASAAAYQASMASEASVASVESVQSSRSARSAYFSSKSARLASLSSASAASARLASVQSRVLVAEPTTTSSESATNILTDVPSNLPLMLTSALPAETGSKKTTTKGKNTNSNATTPTPEDSSIQALTQVVLNLANVLSQFAVKAN